MSLIKVATKGSALSCAEMDSNWDYVLDLGNATGSLDCAKIDPTSLSTCLLANPVITNLQTEIDTANTTIGAVSQDLIDVQTTLQSNINSLTTLVNNQNTTIAGLTTQIASLIAEFNDLTSTVSAFDSRLISLEGRVTTLENAIASGIIVIWSGLLTAIPTSWQLSDGTNGTPDLRSRFILGAGSTYDVNTFGGSATHAHTITGTTDSTALTIDQMPYHNHNFLDPSHSHNPVTGGVGGLPLRMVLGGFGGNGDGAEVTSAPGGNNIHVVTSANNTGIVFNGQGGNNGHTHTVSTSTSLASSLPPYYALAYIIRS